MTELHSARGVEFTMHPARTARSHLVRNRRCVEGVIRVVVSLDNRSPAHARNGTALVRGSAVALAFSSACPMVALHVPPVYA